MYQNEKLFGKVEIKVWILILNIQTINNIINYYKPCKNNKK